MIKVNRAKSNPKANKRSANNSVLIKTQDEAIEDEENDSSEKIDVNIIILLTYYRG